MHLRTFSKFGESGFGESGFGESGFAESGRHSRIAILTAARLHR